MNRWIYILLYIFISQAAIAQYSYQWNRYVGNDFQENAADIIQTYDGNFIILGQKKENTDALWILKITPEGKTIWSKKFYGYPFIIPKRIVETKNKDLFIVSEVREKEHENSNIWLLRTTSGGDKLWERLYTYEQDIHPTSAIETFDGDFVIAAYKSDSSEADADWYILKVDYLGFFIREIQFGSPYDDRIYDLAQLPDSNLVFVGYYSYQKGALRRAAYYKTDKDGNDIIFAEIKDYKWSMAMAVYADKDTGFVIALEYIPDTITLINNIAVLKYDSLTNELWKTEIDTNAICHPVRIIGTFDEGYALLYTVKYDGEFNYNTAIAKFDTNGRILWQKIFYRKSNDYAAAITEAKDNGLYVLSTTYSRENGWNFGIAKFKSLEYSRLKFIFPLRNIITITTDTITVKGCIKTFKKPKKIDVFVNDDLLLTVKKFKLFKKDCNYYFSVPLRLNYGENKLVFKLTDYKDYVFIRVLNVYYFPPPVIHW